MSVVRKEWLENFAEIHEIIFVLSSVMLDKAKQTFITLAIV